LEFEFWYLVFLWCLELGIWSFRASGPWCLELGIWIFSAAQTKYWCLFAKFGESIAIVFPAVFRMIPAREIPRKFGYELVFFISAQARGHAERL
jgi:hypothetical protein